MEMRIDIGQLPALLAAPDRREELSPLFGVDLLLVDGDGETAAANDTSEVQPPPCPVVLMPRASERQAPLPATLGHVIDLVPESEAQLDLILQGTRGNPQAAAVLVQLLRHNERARVADGLFAESLAYSTLQHSGTFTRWLDERRARPAGTTEDGPPLLLDRSEEELSIVLNRPARRNAYSAELRDALHEALLLVAADESLRRATVSGNGEGFCSGGDLAEFGEARDAGEAHVARMTSSVAALLHQLRDRVVFRIHGACIGAGIELPAFSADVSAAPDTSIGLPEVSMGLIPGAGGTVSITKRIGRRRTGYLAISGETIDAERALSWGLIDRIE